jgi:restriction system protein
MISDRIDNLEPWQMQELVGGLLQAMNYNVQISPKGPDGGVDVLAYRMHLALKNQLLKCRLST